MSSPLGPDADVLVRICEQLTTQVRRIADALTPPAPAAPDAGTCNAPGPWGDAHTCRLTAGHDGDHQAHDDCVWHNRHTTQAPATDEDTNRTNRRASLGALLARAERCALSPTDAARLGKDVDAEIREADTARATAAGNRRHVQVMYAELEQTRVDCQAQAELRADMQRDRDQHAAVLTEVLGQFLSHGAGATRTLTVAVAPSTYKRWRSVVAPTVERPWWVTVAELREELKRAEAERDKDRVRIAAVRDALGSLRRTMAHDPRDWGQDKRDAWLWGIVCGWECEEQHDHDVVCDRDNPLRRAAARHRWPNEDVDRLKTYRRAVAALDESRQAPAEVAHPETNPQASQSSTVDEQPGSACPDVQQPVEEGQS
ncbi:hypothetical protein PV396_24560 [Streptomyces sp. ME02-8801-2C]|uniref:hypothetical protein n=1 Tax=Streptomyces sp. ME02-8801-2C TaxID=3028680 RepID=UPI0029BB855E|nr:hypothetical protein [Streptomyces sp. ME02-8801-2C]MDX3455075.1 hypothetical protein [Streptomyces sp. ME02-8801-2C]